MFRFVTWADRLAPYASASDAPLPAGLVETHGHRRWRPNADDRAAAALLHVQFVSRIATQELRYSAGDERSALSSLHALFERTRAACEEHVAGLHFEAVAWALMNARVRPFTARWHRRAEEGGLEALDDADQFRIELAELRRTLLSFDRLLLEIRDGAAPPLPAPAGEDWFGAEMAPDVPWGLDEGDPDRLAGVGGVDAATMAACERKAIEARRGMYGIPAEQGWATGLALSGGGIRSATFALGVLSSLARRGLLAQFDYLSTVSGGGYLGASVVDYLAGATAGEGAAPGAAPAGGAGLRRGEQPFGSNDRDSPAVGHVRQNCRYLAAGSAWERLTVAFAQWAGLLENLLALGAMAALLALLLDGITAWTGADALVWGRSAHLPTPVFATGGLALAAVVATPALAALAGTRRAWPDQLLAIAMAPLLAALAWWSLAALLSLYSRFAADALLAAVAPLLAPLLLLLVATVAARLAQPASAVATVVGRAAAPAFLLGVFMVISLVLVVAPAWRFRLWIGAGALLLYLLMFLDLNFTGLHRHYRKRLASTFLVRPLRGGGVIGGADTKLSSLQVASLGPYPIMNAALNVPSSRRPAMRGRLTDFFSFTPHHCGSPVTGYRATADWETADPGLTLASAMAISGAAISPRMGLATRPQLGFWLSLLNLRLGYWLRDPDPEKGWATPRPGLWYLLRELAGRMDERTAFLNLSDGGHIENLGVYELLRRRCKFIVAVDGEQDGAMTFQGFANLQRLAAIDLGVRIEMDLSDLRLGPGRLSRSHFQFCRIRYPGEHVGYLIYLKLSLTGNEGEFLRRFRLDEPDFPHRPTLDQDFSEARFEAYRSLGAHVGDKLFLESIVGPLARQDEVKMAAWFAAMARSLLDP